MRAAVFRLHSLDPSVVALVEDGLHGPHHHHLNGHHNHLMVPGSPALRHSHHRLSNHRLSTGPPQKPQKPQVPPKPQPQPQPSPPPTFDAATKGGRRTDEQRPAEHSRRRTIEQISVELHRRGQLNRREQDERTQRHVAACSTARSSRQPPSPLSSGCCTRPLRTAACYYTAVRCPVSALVMGRSLFVWLVLGWCLVGGWLVVGAKKHFPSRPKET